MAEFAMVFGWLAVPAVIPALIAGGKGRNPVAWWALGLLFFLPAFVAALVIRPDVEHERQRLLRSGGHRACPHCAELLHREATVCPHCRRDVPVGPGADGEEQAEKPIGAATIAGRAALLVLAFSLASLFIGLFVVTDTLTWIFVAIAGVLTAIVMAVAGLASR